jgi:putative flippase GtrA
VTARTEAGRRRTGSIGREASGFAAVGAVALTVDIGGYNALVHLTGDTWLDEQPLVAKTVSITASTTVAYVGNRFWTYRDRPRGRFAREYTLFFVLSAVGLAIALGCLAFSRYVLGLTSPLADNVSANGVGLVLGSLFRFVSYRRFVFGDEAGGGGAASAQEVDGCVRRRNRAESRSPKPGSMSATSPTRAGDRPRN